VLTRGGRSAPPLLQSPYQLPGGRRPRARSARAVQLRRARSALLLFKQSLVVISKPRGNTSERGASAWAIWGARVWRVWRGAWRGCSGV